MLDLYTKALISIMFSNPFKDRLGLRFMASKQNYSEEDIIEAVLLNALEIENRNTGEGIRQQELFSEFLFNTDAQIHRVIDSLEKGKRIERYFDQQRITRFRIKQKGWKKLKEFRKSANRASRNKYLKFTPSKYQVFKRLREMELWAGSIVMTLVSLIIFNLANLINVVPSTPKWILISTFVLRMLIIISLIIFAELSLITSVILALRVMGHLIRPFYLDIGFYFEENRESVMKIVVYLALILAALLAWYSIGISGLVGGVAILAITLIVQHCFLPHLIELLNKRKIIPT